MTSSQPHRLSSNGHNGVINRKTAASSSHDHDDDEHDEIDMKLPPPNGNGGGRNGTRNDHPVNHDKTHDARNPNKNNNPAKYDEWHDLGRFLAPSSSCGNGNSKHEAAIERNSCMLEDLLATALEYDARVEEADAAATANDTVTDGSSTRPNNNEPRQHVHPAPSQDCSSTSNTNNNEPQDTNRAGTTNSSKNNSVLSPTLHSQIRKYVTEISGRYHHVGFHSFEHASHVMLSATKIVYLLQRQSPLNSRMHRDSEDDMDENNTNRQEENVSLSNNTNNEHENTTVKDLTGTIYDPWLHFAIALSALLHDVDHKGLPNNQLGAESDPLATKYGSEECMKSYAEWNSLDIGLSLLRDDAEGYGEFDRVLGGVHGVGAKGKEGGEKKKKRFYKMVTDLVLCTDIASKERRELGMQKWERACCSHGNRREGGSSARSQMQRRSSIATVVTDNTSSGSEASELLRLYTPEATKAISEQIMQAADVSHTIQHFSTFVKWNVHLYHEVLAAYECGRTLAHLEQKKNKANNNASSPEILHPKESWYESQIGFYDHYIIPLAERLDACGAFSKEHKFAPLAVRNKEQWIEEGRECTRLMVKEAENMTLAPPMPVAPGVTPGDLMVNLSSQKGRDKDGDRAHRRSSSIDTDYSNVPVAEEDMDDMSIPKSVETTSRVSFADAASMGSSSRMSSQAAESMAKWGRSASVSNLSRGDNVDSSVNALVPRILVKQIVDSMQMDVDSVSPEMQMNALRGAVSKYQSAGSIRRHHGALLFVDISGFTNLSQNYPVEDFKTFINEYFTKIIDFVIIFGGEVVKFAGDALYAIWTTSGAVSIDGNDRGGGSSGSVHDNSHAVNIERCTACAIAINAECNNYKVSKSYNRRMSEISNSSHDARGQGEVLYKLQDKHAEYEKRGSVLNVYCGVSEGIMAGVDVVANNRAEFFLVGKPLKDVAKAEELAGPGELVVSPSVYDSLMKRDVMSLMKRGIMPLASKLCFINVESGFQRVTWPNHPPVEDMLLYCKIKDDISNFKNDAHWLIGELVQSTHSMPDDEDPDTGSLQSDLMHLLEYHRHETARDVVGKFTAELRRVVVLFISIMYEPALSEDPSEDWAVLETFQSIFSVISESVSSRSGQVRQFINDDKGTVFIASFGLRGSVILHPSDAAVDAAQEAQKKLLEIMDIQCSIGITLGNIFCGETGSFQRYEFSLLGPSVNLSARLMAKSAWGQINCDEELKNHTGRRHSFIKSGTYKLKGYENPVPFFMPVQEESDKSGEEQDDIVTFFMRKAEVLALADDIIKKRDNNIGGSTTKNQPRIIIIKGDEGKGKDAFITGILKQSDLWNSSVILEANRCFHDDPFYCFTPIITRVLLSFSESRERLMSLKKRYKRSSVLASFLANDAFQMPAFPRGTDIVPNHLKPYLCIVNGLVFKGFPLMKSSLEAKRLKDSEKVEKCIEVLSALIIQFIKLREKPGIISICEMDSIDSYSAKLLRRILSSNANLLIIGGADDSSVPLDEEPSLDDTTGTFLTSILDKESDIDIEMKNLEPLDNRSTFDLFIWSLRREFSHEDREIIDRPELHDKIFQLCGGMTHATALLARTFCSQFQKECQNDDGDANIDVLNYLQTFLNDTPTDFEEIIWFRLDQIKPEEQMLLKIASVAGFDQYSFSQNLLETTLLAISRSEITSIAENSNDLEVPMSVGGDVPNSVGTSDENKFNYMFQGDYFEQTLESLVAHKFLDEVNVEMSDLSSMESVMYRFRNSHEQSVINGLMLNDQKKRTHFEVAAYYSSAFQRGGGDSWGENDSSSVSTDVTSVSSTNWELFHIIALHYDLADVPVPAMLNYYDSSASLASLGLRDKAHGRLLSAYLMLEKVLHHASTLDVKIDESVKQRRHIAGQMVRTIGGEDLKDNMKMLTKDHLRVAFDGDVFAFKKSLAMLTKFGQSVGTIEKEGYLFGSELYIQAILLLLLVLDDDVFANLTSGVGSFLGQLDIKCMKNKGRDSSDHSSFSSEDSCFQDFFDIDDLTISFPAFSGLLTFYRDSPIGANQVQETFLANLFVAVTQEAGANQIIHVLRTKCILSHLYLKHGKIVKALEECEGIKDIYDHDLYSLELVNVYGMDWSLICVAAMASTYLYKGQFAAALHNIEFLKTQMLMLDEFASSTKAMSKGTISSFYLLLHEFENAAEIASGINATQYGYFFKPIGTLQEELANRELALNQHQAFDSSARDFDLLSILSSDGVRDVNQNRSMLDQSAETLSDRGIESVKAALCATEIRNLELQKNRNADTVRKQIRYCQAGLVYLKQSLGQNDANNHERRKNYFMCLYQQTDLLLWHHKLLQLLQDSSEYVQVDDILGIKGTEIDAARKSLDECKELSEKYDYPFMQLLAGKAYIKLGLDASRGKDLIQSALERMDSTDCEVAKNILSRIDDMQDIGGCTRNLFPPPSCQRGVPSAA
mmetsp:Transcript_5910/g.13459  ORF Transcript_5910/g.13459 Transcript_5910/m.13459 type:complete len:2439 (+) Transcript_5910:2-7318(+)